MAMQIADAVKAFQQHTTGHLPNAVTVVLSQDTLDITLHDALTPAEKALAESADGAEKVQEFHRQLFKSAESELRKEIRRITGVAVREAAVEIETTTGAVVHAFTSGSMVQVFRLECGISKEVWNKPGKQSSKCEVPRCWSYRGKSSNRWALAVPMTPNAGSQSLCSQFKTNK